MKTNTFTKDELIEHKIDIDTYGQDMPRIQNWNWSNLL